MALFAALIRGRAELRQLDLSIWLHLATVAAALALTPISMLRRRGDRTHRTKIVISARGQNIRSHRNTAKNTAVGALLIAGFFTFPFGRLLGSC
jgi:uncharacterized membrane protein